MTNSVNELYVDLASAASGLALGGVALQSGHSVEVAAIVTVVSGVSLLALGALLTQ